MKAKYISKSIAEQIGWLPADTRLAIYVRDGFACVYCGAAFEDGTRLAIDHVLPRDLGGPDVPANLVTCCFECNGDKRNMTLATYLRHLNDYGRGSDEIFDRVYTAMHRPLKIAYAKRLLKKRVYRVAGSRLLVALNLGE